MTSPTPWIARKRLDNSRRHQGLTHHAPVIFLLIDADGTWGTKDRFVFYRAYFGIDVLLKNQGCVMLSLYGDINHLWRCDPCFHDVFHVAISRIMQGEDLVSHRPALISQGRHKKDPRKILRFWTSQICLWASTAHVCSGGCTYLDRLDTQYIYTSPLVTKHGKHPPFNLMVFPARNLHWLWIFQPSHVKNYQRVHPIRYLPIVRWLNSISLGWSPLILLYPSILSIVIHCPLISINIH